MAPGQDERVSLGYRESIEKSDGMLHLDQDPIAFDGTEGAETIQFKRIRQNDKEDRPKIETANRAAFRNRLHDPHRRVSRQLRPVAPGTKSVDCGRGLLSCDHSHILKVVREQALALVLMNPAACGHEGWHFVGTLLRFALDVGKISGVKGIELGPRGRRAGGRH
jgi:hypothetical protein